MDRFEGLHGVLALSNGGARIRRNTEFRRKGKLQNRRALGSGCGFCGQGPFGRVHSILNRYVWNSPTNFRDPFGQVGAGISLSGSVEAGVVTAGAGATGSVGGGVFLDGTHPSLGRFGTFGAFAGGVPARGLLTPRVRAGRTGCTVVVPVVVQTFLSPMLTMSRIFQDRLRRTPSTLGGARAS